MKSSLGRYMEAHGITVYWLHKQTDLAYSTIHRLTINDCVGEIGTWTRIADALGCTIDEILNWSDYDERE